MTNPALIFCDLCGAANRAQAAFCKVCGQSFRASNNTPAHPLHTFIYPPATRTTTPPASPNTNSLATGSGTLTGRLTPRHMLKQRYIILAQVGSGGFGAVYRATDTQFGGRLVAIKEMSQSNLNAQETLDATTAFHREALMLANLTHPNLPRIYEQFTDTGRSYLVMDFIEGETLEETLQRKQLPPEQVLAIAVQLCDVLDYLHTRQPPIIFRDLKPANVMLTPAGHLYLIDFGIARHFKPGQTKDTTALGSSGYAAPEQYGKAQTTARADIYSLGATLHQMLTGSDPSDSPFHFTPVPLPHPALTGLDTLIMSMVSIDSAKRPATITYVRHELQRIATQYQFSQTQPLLTAQPAKQMKAVHSGSTPKAKQGPQIRPQANMLYACLGHNKRITALAWSPDGKKLASGSYDRTVQVWNATNGQHMLTCKGHLDHVNAIVWSPDSTRIASASDDGTVRLWDASTGKLLYTYGEHIGPVNALAWAPTLTGNAPLIASAGADRTVQIWNVSTGQVSLVFRQHTDAVQALAWSPDGKRIASGGDDHKILQWTPINEQTQKRGVFAFLTSSLTPRNAITVAQHDGRVTALAWTRDGKYLASASSDHRVLIHDTLANRMLFTFGTDSNSMKNCVTWSPNGSYLAYGGNHKLVEMWNISTRKQTFVYRGHMGYVNAITWSPDGTRIASGGMDHTVQVWQVV